MSVKPNSQTKKVEKIKQGPPKRGFSGWLCVAMAIIASSAVDAAGFGFVVPPEPKAILDGITDVCFYNDPFI